MLSVSTLLLAATLLCRAPLSAGRLSSFKNDLKTGGGSSGKSSSSDDNNDSGSSSSGSDSNTGSGGGSGIYGEEFNRFYGAALSKQRYLRHPYAVPGLSWNVRNYATVFVGQSNLRWNSDSHEFRRFMIPGFERNIIVQHLKRWSLSCDIGYRRYASDFNATGIDLLFNFGMFKLNCNWATWMESSINFRDSMNMLDLLLGFDIISVNGFKLDLRVGVTPVSGPDISGVAMASFGCWIAFFPAKPFVFDMSLQGRLKNEVTMTEYRFRSGIILPVSNSVIDLGAGFSLLKLNNQPMELAPLVSIRFWM